MLGKSSFLVIPTAASCPKPFHPTAVGIRIQDLEVLCFFVVVVCQRSLVFTLFSQLFVLRPIPKGFSFKNSLTSGRELRHSGSAQDLWSILLLKDNSGQGPCRLHGRCPCSSGHRFQSRPALPVASIWEVNQEMSSKERERVV